MIVAAGVICIVGIPVANADLILTVNGINTADGPAMIQGIGPLLIAVEGNTSVEPNDISVEATGGTLVAIQEVQNQYQFEFNAESVFGSISLIANNDISIEGRVVPAGTTICQLYFFCSREDNVISVLYSGMATLIPPNEDEGEQESPPAEESVEPLAIVAAEESIVLGAAEAPAELEPQEVNDTNTLPITGIEEHPRKILLHCPNGVDAITPAPVLSRQTESAMMSGEGSPSTGSTVLTTGALGTGGMMMLDSVIEVNGDITTNQIWTAGNTYHITADVNVKALLVIKPGTIVAFATDKSMAVNNGGTLISSGTPDNPIIYTSDAQYPDYDDYYCPIYIEESASPATKVTYNYIEYAYIGIVVLNNRLDNDIENNYLSNNRYGIVEYGTKHTNITNNLVYGTYYYAIEVYMASTTGQGDANSVITMQNNTCDYYQDVGIMVVGVANPDDAGWVVLTNNIVSGAYCGIYMLGADEYAYGSVSNTGYYDNTYNKSWDFPEDSPVQQTNWPYEEGTGWLPVCYLKQDCNFINAGYEYIEATRLIGKTTDVNSLPDSNKTDIGFHYPNWHFSNPGSGDSLSADFDDNLTVDFNDFAVFANYWRQSTSGQADLDESGFVDRSDLAILADQWLQLADPNIQIQITGDSNNGYVNVGITGFTSDTVSVFLLLDGQYIGEMILFYEGQTLYLDISTLGSGVHELKAISVDNNGKIICSNITEASFSCSFRYCPSVGSYDLNEPYHFCAYYPGSGNVNVKVYDEDSNLVWSQTYPAQNLNGFVPSTITSRDNLDTITFEPPAGGGAAVAKSLALLFNPKKVPSNIRALYISPDIWIHEFANGNVESAVKKAFETQGVPCYALELWSASYKNLAWFAANRNIEYIYFAGHGNFTKDPKKPTFLRTVIKLWDGWAVSAKKSDFLPGGAPSWCEELPGTFEQTMNSMFKIWFPRWLKFVHFDCCFSGRLRLTSDERLVESPEGNVGILAGPESDMSWALGMTGAIDQFYQGWWGDVNKGYATPINSFDVREWNELKNGADLYSALQEAISHAEDEPLDNLRVYGMGLMLAVRIE